MVEAPTLEIRQPGEDLPFLWGFRLGFLLKNDPSMMPNIHNLYTKVEHLGKL